MKRKIIMLVVFIVASVAVSSSCNKEKLTKATQTGENTFSCKVDGEPFIPKDAVTFPVLKGLTSYYRESTRELQLLANEPTGDGGFQRHVSIDFAELKQGRQNFSTSNSGQVIISRHDVPDEYYKTDDISGGVLEITKLDTVENIISGTFSFGAAPAINASRTVSVTDGRFDIKYVE